MRRKLLLGLLVAAALGLVAAGGARYVVGPVSLSAPLQPPILPLDDTREARR